MRRRTPPTKQFSISCTDSEWAQLKACAAAMGTSVSRLLVTSALPDPGPRLALSEHEQRRLSNAVTEIHQTCQAMLEPLPGSDVTLLEAVAFLYRVTRQDAGVGHSPDDAPQGTR